MATQKLCVTFWSNVPANVFNKGYVPARLATGYHVLMRSDDEIQKLFYYYFHCLPTISSELQGLFKCLGMSNIACFAHIYILVFIEVS